MWSFDDTRDDPFNPASPSIAKIFWAAARWLGAIVHAASGRRVLGELSRLDDRMLRDIGISRSDLRDAAAAPRLSDPTLLLFRRAAERRAASKRGPSARLAAATRDPHIGL